MSKRRDYEDLGDVTLSPEEEARVEKAVKQAEEDVAVFNCGPSTRTCRCECGHETPDGSKPVCEHDFQGWVDFVDDDGKVRGGSRVCSRCGMDAMSHDMWVLP